MALSNGSRIGSYEIVAPLGAGGMGEVYRARDSKLKRDVAIKVLPADVAGDRERLARFQREAEVLASLNHPHIAHVYGIEDPSTSSGQAALVMELVEGEDLSQRIARGPIPLEEALSIAKQIAEALEAAHDAGIIHRDLKPANIKVTDDGTVKVLDFGLAKALDRLESDGFSRRSADDEASAFQTITSPAMTMRGVILGTAAYMSPEQAKGRPVDRRADIWAFGCVLFEMLTGKRTFKGDDVTDIITSVMRDAPDWTTLPAETPLSIRVMLRRCLEKDTRKRAPHMAVARMAIDDAVMPTDQLIPGITIHPQVTPQKRRQNLAVPIAAAVAAVLLIGVMVWKLWPAPAALPVVRFQVATPPAAQLQSNYNRQLLAISPDGHTVVFAGDQLYIRSIADQDAQPVPGTQGFTSVTHPTFSPDGRSLVFWAASDRTLKRLTLGSSAPTTLCEMSEGGLGVTWIGDAIYFGDTGQGIMRVSANGGTPETAVAAGAREDLYGPQLLPDGDSLMFTAGTRGMTSWDRANIVVQSIRTKARKTIIEGASDAHYLSTGHLLFTRGGVLYAIAFDPRGLATSGQAIAMVEGVRRAAPGTTGAVQVAVSDGGTLAYMAGPVSASAAALQLAIFDRNGTSEVLNVPLGPYNQPRVSPDGVNVAVDTDDGKEQQVWIYGLSKVSAARRLTFGGSNQAPTWSADGKRVAFQSTRDGQAAVWWQRADGTDTATRLTTTTGDAAHIPQSFSPDGRHLFYDEIKGTAVTLWDWSMADGKATPVAIPPSDVVNDATFSPDGRWFAYTIRLQDPAQSVVYVEPYPPTGARYQISQKGEDGHHAAWSRDGKLLYYTPGPGNRFIALPITTSPTFEVGDPIRIERPFVNAPPASSRTYDTTRDGRILSLRMDIGPDGRPMSPQVHVVLNWFEELKQRVPVK